jgi:hypothetical protein
VVAGSEAGLLHLARTGSLRALRDKARALRHAALSEEELARRRQRKVAFRHWVDDDGIFRISGGFLPEDGMPLGERVDAETKRVAREAKAGKEEAKAWDAYAAEAFLRILNGTSRGKPRRTGVTFVCDLNAYRRGHAHPGEAVRLAGGPRVTVVMVRAALAGDPFIKLALHDGVEVQWVSHFGRYLKAEVRTALELGGPPDFDGQVCACGCGNQYGLQNDHIDPLAHGGPTTLSNLQRLRRSEHAEKSRRERAAGMYVGADGPP